MNLKNNQTVYFTLDDVNEKVLFKQRKKELRHLRNVIRWGYFIEFLDSHRKAVKTLLLSGLLFISFFILNAMAEEWRGYKAIGGEIFIFLLPFIIVSLKNCINDLIDTFRHK